MDKAKKKEEKRIFDWVLSLLPYMCLAFVIIFFIVTTNGRILLPVNINNIVGQLMVLLICAVGSVFIYAMGEINLAVSGPLGFACLFASLTALHVTDNFFLMLIICVGVSMLVNFLIGFLIAKYNLPFFLVTIVIQVLLTAALSYLCMTFNTASSGQTSTINIPTESTFFQFDTLATRIICFVVVLVVGAFLLKFTKVGKYTKALGGSVPCAVQSGVNRMKYIIIAFLFSGFATGMAALVYILRVRQASATAGSGTELSVIIAIVIGGMSLQGGAKTKIIAPVIGAVVYSILDYGMVMIGVPTGMIQAIKGVVFIVLIGVLGIKNRTAELPK